VYGTLSIGERGEADLALVGSFMTGNEAVVPGKQYAIILGTSIKGEAITLCYSAPYRINSRYGTKGRSVIGTDLRSSYAVVGAHFRSVEHLRFDEATLDISNMLELLGHRGVHFPRHDPDAVIEIAVSAFEAIEAELGDCKISVHYGVGETIHKSGRITLTPGVSFHIVLPVAISLSDWHTKYLRPLQNLFHSSLVLRAS